MLKLPTAGMVSTNPLLWQHATEPDVSLCEAEATLPKEPRNVSPPPLRQEDFDVTSET